MKFIQKIKNESIKDAHLRILGLNSTEDINNWFRKSYSGGYWMKGINEIVDLLNKFKDKTIYVLGDYDVDGITATSIMLLGLEWAGFKHIDFKIPRRKDGFGISESTILEIKKETERKGISADEVLLITVDNGIAGIEPVKLAKEYGYTIIITDHHEPTVIDGKVVLPEADLILDANAIENSAEFNGYCGAGNAYKVIMELLGSDPRKFQLTPLAMIGTICDQMGLREENYVIAHKGLKMLNEHLDYCLPGLQAMAKVFGIPHFTATSVGFSIGPALNALERIGDGDARKGVYLLTGRDLTTCLDLAVMLREFNDKRKELTNIAVEKAKAQMEEMEEIKAPIILNVPDIKAGLVGILAGRILEEEGLPVGIFTGGKDGILKGSFRSPEGYDIKKQLDICAEYFEVYGGHAQAAGASVKLDKFQEMVDKMHETAFDDVKPIIKDELYYDVEISNKDIESAIKENELFQPLGNGNDDLIFKITDFEVIPDYGGYKKIMKNNGVRLKSLASTAVGFNNKWEKAKDINGPCSITLYGSIAYNYWVKNNGEVVITPQVQFEELEIQNEDKYLSPFAQALKAKAQKR